LEQIKKDCPKEARDYPESVFHLFQFAISVSQKSPSGQLLFYHVMTPDHEAIQRTLDALYQSICFAKGEKPTFASLRALFLPQALLINNNNSVAPVVMGVEAFIEAVQTALTSGGLEEFYEREIARTIEIFGNIAHVFSTYEARFDATSQEPFSIGINTIQLVKIMVNDAEEWRVSSMAWNDQTPDRPIPVQYLPASSLEFTS
jgi:hypothetical protein